MAETPRHERFLWPGGWQGALLVIWHGGSWLLTWHAPWCRDLECPLGEPRGLRGLMRFDRAPGYVRALGFEFSCPDRAEGGRGDPRFYQWFIRQAEKIWRQYLQEQGNGDPSVAGRPAARQDLRRVTLPEY